jgi:hypothetical protein
MEKQITLYRVFGSTYTFSDSQTWSPYLKRGTKCTTWNADRETTEQMFKDASINLFSKDSIKTAKYEFDQKDVCLLIELQVCKIPLRNWEWATNVNSKSKKVRDYHFHYEGAEDLDDYVWNMCSYNCDSYTKAFYLDGKPLSKEIMDNEFDYMNGFEIPLKY